MFPEPPGSRTPPLMPQLVATTGPTYQSTIRLSHARENLSNGRPDPKIKVSSGGWDGIQDESNFFKEAQWSADGTCLLTSSEDMRLRTFVLPTDLLDPSSLESPHGLKPYSTVISPEPVYATALYPYFNLQGHNFPPTYFPLPPKLTPPPPSTDLQTTIYLSSPRSHPIALHNPLTTSPTTLTTTPLLASYPLIHPPTETYLTPHALLFHPSGTHFLAGTDSLIALFDVSRTGDEPVSRMPTIPSRRKKLVGGGVGMKGVVSCLAVSTDGVGGTSGGGLLAAGTFTRTVGLYDAQGSGSCVAVFSVAEDPHAHHHGDSLSSTSGSGITSLRWSPCGNYLLLADRKSNTTQIYDVRITHRRLATLTGRRAMTNQRMGFDVFSSTSSSSPSTDVLDGGGGAGGGGNGGGGGKGGGLEIWAGGTDGHVRIWRDVGRREGEQGPDMSWAAHGDVVSSAVVHPSGTVAATCSGQRRCVTGAWEVDGEGRGKEEEEGRSSSGSLNESRSSISDGSSRSSASSVLIPSQRAREEPFFDNTLKIWKL
ncbi:MAG: hypothetical protein M1817_005406 [Caeruleum heppii]|nr:MAG: hypothetical protein M1817_005406 [Caeruleum heppii]